MKPIVYTSARSRKQKLKTIFQQSIQQYRLLIITTFVKKIKRVTEQYAVIRNKIMIDLAVSITVGYASEGGSLEAVLQGIYNAKKILNIS